MNAHRVLVLGAVAAVALAAALWSTQTRRPQQESVATQAVVPGLEAGINDVNTVRVRGAGDVLLATLQRGESGWTLEQREGWPVDVDKLREYLLKLARARRVEAKTDNPALHYKLGVEDIAAEDHPGAQVEIDGLAQPVKLIVGRNVPRGSGTYVRHAGEAQSWQADADLAVERNPANWLQRDLVDIAAGRVQRVEVVPPGGPKVEIVAAEAGGAGDFSVANLPRGREPASGFVADATAGFLAALRFDDVLGKADSAAPPGGVTRARFLTREGIAVDVALWGEGERRQATFSASLDEAIAAAHVAAAQDKARREHDALLAAEPGTERAGAQTGEAEQAAPEPPLAATDPDADRQQRLDALHAEVAAINARVEGRAFVLPAYKTTNLGRSLEDYLKPRG